MEPIKIDQVVIGSCTNGRMEDMRKAAAILQGHTVHPDVRVMVVPATQKIYKQCIREGLLEIFVDAGCAVNTPSCGPCMGGHMGVMAAGEKCVSTTNRNFVGRMGHVAVSYTHLGERVALNYLQRMSGIASYTHSVASLLEGSRTKLLDTRKTTPNMRIFEKYAVRVGGGYNHRYNLSDGVLLKDNHIGAAGSVAKAVQMAKEYAPFVRKIEVEVENLDMVKEAVEMCIRDRINAVLQIVRIHFKIEFNEKSISYERFLTHLKFFATRVFDNTIYQDSMQEIYKVLIEENEYAYSGVRKIVEYIEKQYSYKLTIDERLYLLIHIKRILDEQSE